MSTLSDLLPAGSGGKNVDFVASGTLTSGQTVSLLSNGKVEASGVESVTASLGSVNSLGVNGTRATIAGYYDPDENACVIIYSGVNDYMTAVAGTISGTTITFGSPSIGYSFSTNKYTAAYDTTNNAGVVVYYSDGNTGNFEAKQLNVSGTTSNWETGNGTQVHTSSNRSTSIVFCPNSDRFLATWNQSGQGLLRHCIGQISGTSTSWTSYVDNFNGQYMNCYDGGWRPVLSYDPTYEVVLIAQTYRYSPYYMSYMVVSVGSSSASATINQTALNSYYSDTPFSAYNVNDKKHVLAYTVAGGMDVVPIQFTSNSAVSFTTPTVSSGNFGPTIGNSNVRDANGIGYNPLMKKTGLMYSDSLGEQDIVSVDTSTSTYTTGTNLPVQNTYIGSKQERPVLYDSSSTNMFIAFKSGSAGTTYDARTYTMDGDVSNLSDFIGITDAAISDTATGSVTIKGGIATTQLPLSAVYNNQNFSLSGQSITTPEEIRFKPDGTKFYILGNNVAIYQYAMSTAWDVSTASYENKSFNVSAQEANSQGLALNADGTSFYTCGSSRVAYQYDLTTAYDVSTASYASKSFSLSGQISGGVPWGLDFDSTGTKLYVIGSPGTVYQYTLSTAFDVSTASYASKSFDTTSQTSDTVSLALSSDGASLYVMSNGNDTVFKYTLSTPNDLATASYSGFSFTTTSQDTTPYGVAVKTDDTQVYITGAQNDSVYQYSLSTSLTPNSVYYVQGDGTISTTSTSPAVRIGKALSSTSINLEFNS